MVLDYPAFAFPAWAEQFRGLGATSTAPISTQLEAAGASLAGTAAGILALSPATGPLAPFVAGAAAIIGLLAAFGVGSGCGQSCVLSTQYANQAEAALAQNIQAYFSIPAPRTPAQQQAAESLFTQVWNDLEQQCSNPSLGAPGQRCISDRQSGACTWKQTTTSPLLSIPGEPQPGECWNWWSGYHDPIVNDPDVAAASVSSDVTTAADSALASVGVSSSLAPLVIGAGLLFLLAVIL
jgi:hypothetical protein